MYDTPPATAARGVAWRACSPDDSPGSTTPGVTINGSGPRWPRSSAASRGEAITPSQPDSMASRASRPTWAVVEAVTPMSARSVSVMPVTTVSASTRGRGKSRAAVTAAFMMPRPPMLCTVTIDAPRAPAARTARAAEFGISKWAFCHSQWAEPAELLTLETGTRLPCSSFRTS